MVLRDGVRRTRQREPAGGHTRIPEGFVAGVTIAPMPPRTDAAPLDPAPPMAETLDLVRRGRGGDRSALDQLVARYQDRVRRIVSIRMGGQFRGVLDSLDLAQDTWMAALRGLSSFEPRGHGSVIAWLTRIAENQVLDAADRLNAARRDRRREETADDAGAASTPTPSETAARRELRDIYDECVAALEPAQREVVLLRDYSLLEWSEVRERMGSASVHAAQELHRRAQLKLGGLIKQRLGPS